MSENIGATNNNPGIGSEDNTNNYKTEPTDAKTIEKYKIKALSYAIGAGGRTQSYTYIQELLDKKLITVKEYDDLMDYIQLGSAGVTSGNSLSGMIPFK